MADKKTKSKKTRKAKPATRKAIVSSHVRDDEPTAVDTPEVQSEAEPEVTKVPAPKVKKVAKPVEKVPLASVRLKENGPDRYTFQGQTYFKGAPVPIAGREQIEVFKRNGFFVVAEG